MKKRIITIVLLIAILAQLALVCNADTEMLDFKVRSAYWTDGRLYTYAHLGDFGDGDEVSLTIRNVNAAEAKAKTLKDAGDRVRFTVLVDNSSSMPGYHSELLTLVRQLMETQQDLVLTVAYFDKDYQVVAEDLTEWNQVQRALGRIQYVGNMTDIAGCVAQAVMAMGKLAYPEGGEMRNLLVVTDGKPWYSEDPQEQEKGQAAAESMAEQVMEAYPEILVHTYVVGSWDPSTQELLTGTKGLHLEGAAKSAGEALAEFTDGLYSVQFRLQGYDSSEYLSENMNLKIERSMVSIGPVRNVGITPEDPEPVATEPEETDPTETAPDETKPEETDPEDTKPGETDPEDTKPGETDPEDTKPEEPDPSESKPSPFVPGPNPSTGENDSSEDAGSTDTTDTTDGGDGEDGNKNRCWILWCLLGLLVVAGLTVMVIVLVQRKKSSANAIRIRIQLVAGGGVALKKMYNLQRELLIGTDPDCDVRITGAHDRSNARIFIRGQMIYVEDLGPAEDVLLNQMRLFSSNRLRSGDELTVGSVTLRIQF